MLSLNRNNWFPYVLWLLVFFMFFQMGNFFEPWNYALSSSLFTTFTMLSMYYFTTKFLYPRFYAGKSRYYFHISITFVLAFSVLFFLIDWQLLPDFKAQSHDRPPWPFHLLRYVMTMAFIFFVGTSLSLMQNAAAMKEREKLLIKEKLESELQLLKAQINPHFIFNALNNIYSLTYLKSKNAPESVLKLSEMLRYVFYDCSKDRVPISAELKYIENFNAFQQMKSDFTQNITLQCNSESASIEVAPMLLIPFIENAFKYSRIEEDENAYVSIHINTEHGKVIFKIENSIPTGGLPAPGSGLGIENVKHRLAIIYPDNHELNIHEREGVFVVDLQIDLT